MDVSHSATYRDTAKLAKVQWALWCLLDTLFLRSLNAVVEHSARQASTEKPLKRKESWA